MPQALDEQIPGFTVKKNDPENLCIEIDSAREFEELDKKPLDLERYAQNWLMNNYNDQNGVFAEVISSSCIDQDQNIWKCNYLLV